MSENSLIEWCDHTFNPWEGCTKIAPECDNCYAAARDCRFTAGRHWGPKAPRRRTSAENWKKPLSWNRNAEAFQAQHGRRQRVFCASLADVFDNAVAEAWRDDLWNIIRVCYQLDWLILTKRPQNIEKMLPPDWDEGWAHVWLGTSAGTQKTADLNIPALLAVPAELCFLSCEPMLERIDLRYNLIDWVICGGESGPNARPMRMEWAWDLRVQCINSGIPFFMKQLSQESGKDFKKFSTFPADLRVREFPREYA